MLELLVVISVIAVLVAILLPVISSVRASSHKAGCVSNLRQVGVALSLYAAGHGGLLPFGQRGEGDERKTHAYWDSPVTLSKNLVGTKGEAGYLDYHPRPERPSGSTWSNFMHCPGDPNDELWAASYGYSRSYMYRQSDIASGTSGTGKPIRLGQPRTIEEVRPRWLVVCRWSTPGTSNTPYAGGSQPVGRGRHPSASIDGSSVNSYWHKEGSPVLYEDGSVWWRSYPDESLGQW